MKKMYSLIVICCVLGAGPMLVSGADDKPDEVRIEIIKLKPVKGEKKDAPVVVPEKPKVDKPVAKPGEVTPPKVDKVEEKVVPAGTPNEMLAKLVKEGLEREKVLLLENKQLKTEMKQMKSELQNAIKIIRVQQQSIETLKKELAKNREVSLKEELVEYINVD